MRSTASPMHHNSVPMALHLHRCRLLVTPTQLNPSCVCRSGRFQTRESRQPQGPECNEPRLCAEPVHPPGTILVRVVVLAAIRIHPPGLASRRPLWHGKVVHGLLHIRAHSTEPVLVQVSRPRRSALWAPRKSMRVTWLGVWINNLDVLLGGIRTVGVKALDEVGAADFEGSGGSQVVDAITEVAGGAGGTAANAIGPGGAQHKVAWGTGMMWLCRDLCKLLFLLYANRHDDAMGRAAGIINSPCGQNNRHDLGHAPVRGLGYAECVRGPLQLPGWSASQSASVNATSRCTPTISQLTSM